MQKVSLESGFRIGEIEVHPPSGVIRGPRGETRVEPKSMSVLIELARHAPEVRSRDRIVAAAPETASSDPLRLDVGRAIR